MEFLFYSMFNWLPYGAMVWFKDPIIRMNLGVGRRRPRPQPHRRLVVVHRWPAVTDTVAPSHMSDTPKE